MRRSVDRVFADSRDSDLADSLRANVSRFAAYKADYVKTTIENILNDASIPAKDKQAYIDANMNAFSQYQATEETTATSRSRTAKQWKEFNDPQRLRLFPNLRWLPSRSIEKRQSHIQFYDHVWSKGDDFWNHNTPGTEWNCKCDVEETDDPVTNNSNMDPVQVPAGLEGNPAITREIFTDRASYIKKGNKQRVEKFWKPIEEGFETYRQYRDDANYKDVKMNWNNGGMMATHNGHNFDKDKGWYETEVQNVGMGKGHWVILEKEVHSEYQKKNTEGLWDDLIMEIAGKETATSNNIRDGLKHCATKPNCEVAVLFFPNNNFKKDIFLEGLHKYNGLKNDPNQWKKFNKIICISNKEIVYEKSHIIDMAERQAHKVAPITPQN